MLLSRFESIRPPYETSQQQTLEWLIEAHVQAESKRSSSDIELFRQNIGEKMRHVGCKPDKINKRGHILDDYLHRDWEQMRIFRLHETPSGADLGARMALFDSAVDGIFERFYPEAAIAPDDLIHVSCTGYVSPSGAQKIASKRGWGEKTVVTHAYHMGCYGAIVAVRLAQGFLSQKGRERADIAHTEICSLHTNPSLHAADQLVSQSLFADGFIKYSASKTADEPHCRLLAVHEEIIPNSTGAMTWNVMSWGHEMSLAKEVPILIGRHLPRYLERLAQKGNLNMAELLKKALFAVHPGGPKILQHIQELVKLDPAQMAFSVQILRDYGNMSSATLPHIWQAILNDPSIPDQTPIVSLAFGPGLSVCGAILEKRCG